MCLSVLDLRLSKAFGGVRPGSYLAIAGAASPRRTDVRAVRGNGRQQPLRVVMQQLRCVHIYTSQLSSPVSFLIAIWNGQPVMMDVVSLRRDGCVFSTRGSFFGV